MKSNRIGYAVLLFLSLVFVIFYGSRTSFIILYMILFMPILSILLAYFSSRRFYFKQKSQSEAVFKGDQLDIEIQLRNRDVFAYPYVSLILYDVYSNARDKKGKRFVVDQQNLYSVPPRSSCTVHVNVDCRYRGFYAVGVNAMEVYDLLGLVRFSKELTTDLFVTIYPRIERIVFLPLITDVNEESSDAKKSPIENYTDVSDIRLYQYSDSMKKIHWKLSSKRNELMVKNYSSTIENNVLLIVDLERKEYPGEGRLTIEDKIIETALSILDHCTGMHLKSKLLYYTDTLITAKCDNPQDFSRIYSMLARVAFEGDMPPEKIMKILLTDNQNGMNLIVVTDMLTSGLEEQIAKAASIGYNALLFCISSWEQMSEERIEKQLESIEKLRNNAVTCYFVETGKNLKDAMSNK